MCKFKVEYYQRWDRHCGITNKTVPSTWWYLYTKKDAYFSAWNKEDHIIADTHEEAVEQAVKIIALIKKGETEYDC